MQRERYEVLEPIHEPGKCAQGLMSLTDCLVEKEYGRILASFCAPFVEFLLQIGSGLHKI